MMFWLIFKVIPVGFIVRVLAIAMLATAAIAGLMVYGALADPGVCEGAEDYQTCLAEETTKDNVLDIISSPPAEASQTEVDAVNAAVDGGEIDFSDEDVERIEDWLAEEQKTTTDSGDSGDSADGPDDDAESTDDSVMFYHGQGVRLLDVTFDDGDAIVRMSSENGGEEVVITDSSRKTSGEMERYHHELNEGENTFRIPLHNPSNGAVTIDAVGRIYLEPDEDNINLAPDKGHAIGVAFGGAAILIALLVGLHLWQTRRADEAKNPL